MGRFSENNTGKILPSQIITENSYKTGRYTKPVKSGSSIEINKLKVSRSPTGNNEFIYDDYKLDNMKLE